MSIPDADKPYGTISTGSLSLDYAVGIGGLVKGRVAEIWGTEGAGKTTLVMLTCAEAQEDEPDQLIGWVDAEHTFDAPWAKAHGMDLDRTRVITPHSAEDVADAVKEMIRSGLFSVVVLDSVGAMIGEKEIDKAADEATMGIKAKIVTRMVNIAATECPITNTTFIIVNQVRANLGYGADTTTGGGWALKHASTMKFKVSRTGTSPFMQRINGEDMVVGHEIKVKVERNKVAPAYREATMVLFNQNCNLGPIGIDTVDETATLGIKLGIIEQAGAWFTIPGGERVQGRPAVIAALRNDPERVKAIRELVLATRAGEVDTSALDVVELEEETGE